MSRERRERRRKHPLTSPREFTGDVRRLFRHERRAGVNRQAVGGHLIEGLLGRHVYPPPPAERRGHPRGQPRRATDAESRAHEAQRAVEMRRLARERHLRDAALAVQRLAQPLDADAVASASRTAHQDLGGREQAVTSLEDGASAGCATSWPSPFHRRSAGCAPLEDLVEEAPNRQLLLASVTPAYRQLDDAIADHEQWVAREVP